MAEIDPVKFGELCANVEHTTRRLGELVESLNAYSEQTQTKLAEHDTEINSLKNDSAVKKGALLGMLGGGALAGAAIPEGLKKIFEAIGKAL